MPRISLSSETKENSELLKSELESFNIVNSSVLSVLFAFTYRQVSMYDNKVSSNFEDLLLLSSLTCCLINYRIDAVNNCFR